MEIEHEIRHLKIGVHKGEELEKTPGLMVFKVESEDGSEIALGKIKEVMQIVLEQSVRNWLSDDDWLKILPTWFVSACVPERSIEQVEEDLVQWRSLSDEEQQRREEEESWSALEWLRWFQPSDDPYDQRMWFWWDSWLQDANSFFVVVEVTDVPLPLGSLMWLFKASGAKNIQQVQLPSL